MKVDWGLLLVDDRDDDRKLMEILLREQFPAARLVAPGDAVSLGQARVSESYHGAVINADLDWCNAFELVGCLRAQQTACVIILYSQEGIKTLTPEIADLGLSGFYSKKSGDLIAIPQVLKQRLREPSTVAPAKTDSPAVEPSAVLPRSKIPGTVTELTPVKPIPRHAVADDYEQSQDATFRTEMFYAISHDLKQPLQIFSRQIRLLDKNYKNDLDGAGKGLIDNMANVAAHMEMLLDSIFAYYRLDVPAKVDEDTVTIVDVVDSVLGAYQSEIADISAEVVLGELPRLPVNRGRMTQLFQNLVNNAIKFRSTAPLHLEISALDVDDYWLFTVQDNGIGVEQEKVEQIFTLFKRLHCQEKYPGSGVGLALCKRIVEQQKGKIWARSKPGKGTAVHFTLPKQGTGKTQRLIGAERPGNEKSDKGTAG